MFKIYSIFLSWYLVELRFHSTNDAQITENLQSNNETYALQ